MAVTVIGSFDKVITIICINKHIEEHAYVLTYMMFDQKQKNSDISFLETFPAI